jgi:hypothetical protein
LLKDTSISEGLRAQFRAEVFNVANHANFALPAAGVFTASGRNNCRTNHADRHNIEADSIGLETYLLTVSPDTMQLLAV